MREWDYSDIIYDEMRDKYNNNNVKLNSDWTIDTDWEKGKEVKDEEKNTNEKAMSVVDIQPIPVDVMKSIENFTNEIKDIPENIAKYMKAIFYSTLITMGAITYAQADTLSFNTTTEEGASVGVIVPNVDYKNYDDNIFEKVEKACNTAIYVGDNNIKNETPNELRCADDGGDAYGIEYDKKQEKIAADLRKNTANNYKIADDLDKTADDLDKTADDLDKTADDLDKTADDLDKTADDLDKIADDLDKIADDLDYISAELKKI